jgi:hypothetical protein
VILFLFLFFLFFQVKPLVKALRNHGMIYSGKVEEIRILGNSLSGQFIFLPSLSISDWQPSLVLRNLSTCTVARGGDSRVNVPP